MSQAAPLRPDLTRNFKRWPTKKLEELRDRLMAMPETADANAPSEELNPELVYFKSDPRWGRLHETIMQELAPRQRSAELSRKGVAGQGKVRGPRR